jgi:predicted transcriptional regulator
MKTKKGGRLSKEEKELIRTLVDSLSVHDIADQLNRSFDAINQYIKNDLKVGLTREEVAAYSLEDRPYWYELEAQFTEKELELFKYHWSKIISQFKDDVFPTEEIQVVDVIKLEILMNRCLKGNKENIEQISSYEHMIQDERSQDKDQQDMDYIINLERQVATLRASQESLNRDYRELQAKKGSMLKEMKGTREQRIKRLEDSKQSFTSWVAAMMQDPDRMKQYGVEMEKMRIAMNREKERLAQFHTFDDGIVDQPFFNTRYNKGLTMDPESLSVILPCWSLAIGVELLVAWFFVNMVKDKKK